MSFLTGTNTELIYCMPASGTALASSITQTVISANSATIPACLLPALSSIWQPSYVRSSAMRIVARGIFGTTSTPTLKISALLNTTQGAITGIVLASTGAFTTASGASNYMFELEFDLTITSIGNSAGTGSLSLTTGGTFTQGPGNNAATASAATGPTLLVGSTASITTVSATTPYYLEITGQWGTSSASNTVTLTQLMVFGLN